jgi:type III pantothenate kinase
VASNWLLVDAGNTRIKWGIHDGRTWVALDAVPTADAADLSDAWTPVIAVRQALASNVAGAGVAETMKKLCAAADVELRFIRAEARQLGVVNGYTDPAQLGSDRWAALVAAHQLERGHKLVVNAGTALTVDALTDEGRFLGGLIVPGPALMRRSLDRGTAGLRLTEGVFRHFPTSTPDAITTGAVLAATGAIERMGAAMAHRGTPAARIVLSGGAAPEIAGHLHAPHAIHENLVLEGLALIARAS